MKTSFALTGLQSAAILIGFRELADSVSVTSRALPKKGADDCKIIVFRPNPT